jgi:hypothetical protein
MLCSCKQKRDLSELAERMLLDYVAVSYHNRKNRCVRRARGARKGGGMEMGWDGANGQMF